MWEARSFKLVWELCSCGGVPVLPLFVSPVYHVQTGRMVGGWDYAPNDHSPLLLDPVAGGTTSK